jgi:YgiT-type zinc finger domain-containing protein
MQPWRVEHSTVFMPNNKKAQTIACDVCGRREAQTKYLTRTFGKGANLLVIENVPVVVCPSCGESYLTAETLHELERIKLHRRSLAKPRSVAVASFI